MKRLIGFFAFVLLAAVTQIGALVFVVCWAISRLALPATWQGWRRAGVNVALFAVLYAAATFGLVPAWAAFGGRVPLPCYAEPDRPFAAGHPLYCVLNRHYVEPRLVTLLAELARAVDRAHPGTTTLYLDGNFPFLDGFPLLPHLSHNDGRKLDLAYYYRTPDGAYRPGALRSPIGYWAFEQPGRTDTSPCARAAWLSLRWDMAFLQNQFRDFSLEPARTRTALQWLVTDGERFGVERVFIEPYLAARLGVSSRLLGFQGCRAARHDDHIHVQITR